MKRSKASPCSAKWADMVGDDRVRMCQRCDRNVYNVARMSTAEYAELVADHEGDRLCIRAYLRPDGTAITRDCPVGRRRRVAKWAAVIAAAIFGSAFLLSRGGPPAYIGTKF